MSNVDAGSKLLSGTVTVRGYSANRFGLYGVHGNVREWVWDAVGLYSESAAGVADPLGPAATDPLSRRGSRGGSWADPAAACRSADRGWHDPRLRSAEIGIRLVKTE